MSVPRPWMVTGAAGFLGSHVVDTLLDRGVPVVGVDNFSWGRLENLRSAQQKSGFTLAVANIQDAPAMKALVRQHQPEAVVHLAALHFIPAAIADPPTAVDINVRGTQSVLNACREADVQRVWFASTADVYAPKEGPHNEDDAIGPFNIYGLTKLMGEQLIRLEARTRTQTRFVIGRLFNLYGARETNPHILPEIVKQLQKDRNAALKLGNLWPKRDLVPVVDAARAVVEMTLRGEIGVTTTNVGTGVAQSMEQMIEQIGVLMRRPLKVETDASRVRAVERPHLEADTGRLKKMIGWAPHSNLNRGLQSILEDAGLIAASGDASRRAA